MLRQTDHVVFMKKEAQLDAGYVCVKAIGFLSLESEVDWSLTGCFAVRSREGSMIFSNIFFTYTLYYSKNFVQNINLLALSL